VSILLWRVAPHAIDAELGILIRINKGEDTIAMIFL
jgi:hypothetical protein